MADELTPEQRRIAEADPDVRMLVTAGPGTGKTHTLIRRLKVLIEHHGLRPGSELLLLSFSRAAVREIRERTRAAGGNLRFVRAVTFDSFATRLLADFQPNGAWMKESFDGRIGAALSLLRDDADAQDLVAGFGHVIVDEVQDLVGVRAEFVERILEICGGGFTLLGDPAQGIYCFSVEGTAREEGSARLYRSIRRKFRGLEEHPLTANHRAETDDARRALWAGPQLNAADPDYLKVRDGLEKLVGELTAYDLATGARLIPRRTGRTAILCHDNGQALMISRELRRAGVAHRVQRDATERAVPAWVGTVLGDLPISRIGKDAFVERAAELLGPEWDAESHFKLLQRAGGTRGDDLDIRALAQRILTQNLPDELSEQVSAQVVVSTIHRAKGLEFDRVFVTMPRVEEGEDPADYAEKTRVWYVALTRPKKELLLLHTPRFRGLRCDEATQRWVRKYERWRVKDVQVSVRDVESDRPAGTLGAADNPAAVRQLLMNGVAAGDAVRLTKTARLSERGNPIYRVEHEKGVLGRTAETFSDSLFRVLRSAQGPKVRWPDAVEELTVEGIDTVAGTEAAAQAAGLGCSPVWLRVRVSGLGALVFERDAGREAANGS